MELKVLHHHGWSISQLAREFNLNWRTVKREVTSDGPRHYSTRAKPTALTAAQQAHLERRFAGCPTLRATVLHHELCRDYGYTGSYRSLLRHLDGLRPARAGEPLVRFETDLGVQVQADWAHLGLWPLGEHRVELYALVAILGYSRTPAVRFAIDHTRSTTFERLLWCLDDLGGTPKEILTDRDAAFCIGTTRDGNAILAPEWVDLCATLGVVPRTCRPYRAKTKGKVERMVREVKESLLPWLSGQILPAAPTITDYDQLALQWRKQIILPRRHRTTKRIIRDAWQEERPLLLPVPQRLLHAPVPPVLPPSVIDLTARRAGEHVETRPLAEYEAAIND